MSSGARLPRPAPAAERSRRRSGPAAPAPDPPSAARPGTAPTARVLCPASGAPRVACPGSPAPLPRTAPGQCLMPHPVLAVGAGSRARSFPCPGICPIAGVGVVPSSPILNARHLRRLD
ncbi:hypothetical protein SSCG_04774 [Streptomyces clavuligerus]|nr:hypothetical protein SSCG_04774 [Streptomyces clavuligerus]